MSEAILELMRDGQNTRAQISEEDLRRLAQRFAVPLTIEGHTANMDAADVIRALLSPRQ